MPILTLCYPKDVGKYQQNFAGKISKHSACIEIQNHLPEAVHIVSSDDHILF